MKIMDKFTYPIIQKGFITDYIIKSYLLNQIYKQIQNEEKEQVNTYRNSEIMLRTKNPYENYLAKTNKQRKEQ